MRDVADQIRAYAEAVEATVPDRPVGEAVGLRKRSRRRMGRAVFAAAAAIVLGTGVLLVLDNDHDRLPVVSGPDERPSPDDWDLLPDAPIVGRQAQVTVATDDELVVWGGRAGADLADGAAWSFDQHRWRTIAPSPLSARFGAVGVWTGQEVVIWGGTGGNDALAYDGAAYNPAADRWRSLPAVGPSIGALDDVTGAAWTGSELLLTNVQGRMNEFLPSDTFALDPSSGEWRALPPKPHRPSKSDDRGVRGVTAAWTGNELLVVSITDGVPVTIDRLDPASEEWAPTVSTEVNGLQVEPDAVVWTGDRLVIAGSYEPGAVYQPGTEKPITLEPSRTQARYPAQALGGTVSVGDRILDLATLEWSDAATIPVEGTREFPGTAAHEGRLYVWGGSGCPPNASCIGFVGVGPGLVWTPPSRDEGVASSTTEPSGSSTTHTTPLEDPVAPPTTINPEPAVPEPLPRIAVGQVRIVARGSTDDYQWQLRAWRSQNELCLAVQRTKNVGDDADALGALAGPVAIAAGTHVCDAVTAAPPAITGFSGAEPFPDNTPGQPSPAGETRHHFSYGFTSNDARLVIGTVEGKKVSQALPQPIKGLNMQPWIIEVPDDTHYNDVDYEALDAAGNQLGVLTSDTPRLPRPTTTR